MPRSQPTISEVEKMINELRRQRQEHTDALAEIDETFARLGISPEPAAGAEPASRPAKKKTAKKKKAAKAAAKKAAGKKKSGRVTAKQFILRQLRSPKTTAQIKQAWERAGRNGRPDTPLMELVQAGEVKREKLEGTRGSRYRLA